ncbi:MAG: sialidase family protein [Opitutaceae bacterium]
MKITPLTLLLLLCLPARCLFPHPLPPWAAINPAGHPVRIAVHAPADSSAAHLSWPKVVRTAKGTVVLAYSAGIGHNIGGSGLAVSLSKDGGMTFTPPRELMRFPDDDPRYRDCGNAALGLAEDGSILLLAMAYNRDSANHIFGWRSVTDGATWMPTDTSALGPEKTGSVFGNIIPLKGRGLAVFGHYRAGSSPHTQGVWMSLSPDAGRSWGTAQRITDMGAVEPAVVHSAGRLVGFFRGDSNNARGRQSVGVSDDLGRSWKTELSVLDAQHPDQARLAAPFAVEDPGRAGELIVLTTERAVPGNTPGLIWLWRGSAQKLEWKRERVLLEFPRVEGDANTDLGYPWLLHTGGHRWQMYYYHGNPRGACHIWVTEVEL